MKYRPGTFAGLHRLAVQFARVHPSQRHFGLGITLRAAGMQRPAPQGAFQRGERLRRILPQWARAAQRPGERLRHAGRQPFGEHAGQGGILAAAMRVRQPVLVTGRVRQQVEDDLRRRFAGGRQVGRDLQHRRTAQAAVREEEALPERPRAAGPCQTGQRHAAEFRAEFQRLAFKSQRHQPGAWRHDPQAELPREPVGQIAAAELRPGDASRRHHQRARPERAARRLHPEFTALLPRHRPHLAARVRAYPGVAALRREHPDDLPRRAVAEKLAELLFVVGNAVRLDERDKVRRRVARQGRATEIRLLGDVIVRRGVEVGEVAASAARNENLLADALGPLQHSDGPPPLPGRERAHQSGRARAEHEHVGGEGSRRRVHPAAGYAMPRRPTIFPRSSHPPRLKPAYSGSLAAGGAGRAKFMSPNCSLCLAAMR